MDCLFQCVYIKCFLKIGLKVQIPCLFWSHAIFNRFVFYCLCALKFWGTFWDNYGVCNCEVHCDYRKDVIIGQCNISSCTINSNAYRFRVNYLQNDAPLLLAVPQSYYTIRSIYFGAHYLTQSIIFFENIFRYKLMWRKKLSRKSLVLEIPKSEFWLHLLGERANIAWILSYNLER